MPMNDTFLSTLRAAGAGALDGVTLHSADPGAAGTSNASAAGKMAAAFEDDGSGNIALSAAVNFTGGTPDETVAYAGFWSGATYQGSGEVTTGDLAFNADGDYTLAAYTIPVSAS